MAFDRVLQQPSMLRVYAGRHWGKVWVAMPIARPHPSKREWHLFFAFADLLMWIANYFATFLSSLRAVFRLIRQKSQAPCDFFEAAVKPTVYRQSPTWQSWWSPLDWQVLRLYTCAAISAANRGQFVPGMGAMSARLLACWYRPQALWCLALPLHVWALMRMLPACNLHPVAWMGTFLKVYHPRINKCLSICPWPWRKSYIGSNIWLFLSYEICCGLEDWFSCETICSWFCSCFHGRKDISFHMTLVVALAPTTTLATPASRRVYEFSIFDTCVCEMMYFKFACPRCSRSLKIPFHAFERALRERSSRIVMEHNLVASSVHFHWPILFPGKDMEMLLDEAG